MRVSRFDFLGIALVGVGLLLALRAIPKDGAVRTVPVNLVPTKPTRPTTIRDVMRF